MAAQSGQAPNGDNSVYRAVAAGESADDVRRAIESSRAVAPGSSAQQQRAAAVNHAEQTGETPLQAAHRQRRGDLVGLLLENGAETAGGCLRGLQFEGCSLRGLQFEGCSLRGLQF